MTRKRISLDELSVEPIVARIVQDDGELNTLLGAIEKVLPEWKSSHEHALDAVYRTRMRHMFGPRQTEERIAAFSRHLHVVGRLVSTGHKSFSARLRVYELLLNDALKELQTGTFERILQKSHVADILHTLSATGNALLREDLRRLIPTQLNQANFSRVIGLLESAGLITRTKQGKAALYQITELGLRTASKIHRITAAANPVVPQTQRTLDYDQCKATDLSKLPPSRRSSFLTGLASKQISAFSRSPECASLSYGGSGGIFIPSDDGPLIVVNGQETDPETIAIPKSSVAAIGFKEPDSVADGWRLCLDLLDDGGSTFTIGQWRGPFQPLEEWVGSLWKQSVPDGNAAIPVIESPTLMRVMSRNKLVPMPGYSMSAVSKSFAEYRRPWMDEVIRHLNNISATKAGKKNPFPVQWNAWPTEQAWDTIFRRILSHSSIIAPNSKLDVCFEFIYLDDERNGRYSLVEIAKLHSFSVICHENNPAAARMSDKSLLLTPSNPTTKGFEEWLEFLKAEAVSGRRGAMPLLITQTSTVADNLVNDIAASQLWSNSYWRRCIDTKDLIVRLNKNIDTGLIVCDAIVGLELMRNWRGVGKLESYEVAYERPVRVGLPCDKEDVEWRGYLLEALIHMMNSGDESVRSSWQNTLDELRSLGAEITIDQAGKQMIPLNDEYVAHA